MKRLTYILFVLVTALGLCIVFLVGTAQAQTAAPLPLTFHRGSVVNVTFDMDDPDGDPIDMRVPTAWDSVLVIIKRGSTAESSTLATYNCADDSELTCSDGAVTFLEAVNTIGCPGTCRYELRARESGFPASTTLLASTFTVRAFGDGVATAGTQTVAVRTGDATIRISAVTQASSVAASWLTSLAEVGSCASGSLMPIIVSGAWRKIDCDNLPSGGADDGDKGDITVSGSGTVWTIDNAVVSTAMLAFDVATQAELDAALTAKQDDLDVPSQLEAETGTATTERVWTAERVAQAIAALSVSDITGGLDAMTISADAVAPDADSLFHSVSITSATLDVNNFTGTLETDVVHTFRFTADADGCTSVTWAGAQYAWAPDVDCAADAVTLASCLYDGTSVYCTSTATLLNLATQVTGVCSLSNGCLGFDASAFGEGDIVAGTASGAAIVSSSGEGTGEPLRLLASGELGYSGPVSSPGSGANSEAFGAGASAGQDGGVAIGSGAAVTASGANGNSVVIGTDGSTSANLALCIGYATSCNSAASVAVGAEASTTGNFAASFGYSALASASSTVALGYNTTAGGVAAVAVGRDANASHNYGMALGWGAATSTSNQVVIGGANSAYSNLYMGQGVTNASPVAASINATGGSGTDVAGASLTIAGGRGTGAGAGGVLRFQVAPASGSSATLNTLVTSVTLRGTGGLDIEDTGTKPTCDSTTRGTFFVDEGGAGVADTVEVCAKDAGDAYAWRTIY